MRQGIPGKGATPAPLAPPVPQMRQRIADMRPVFNELHRPARATPVINRAIIRPARLWHDACFVTVMQLFFLRSLTMKKVLSSIVAALVALSFAGVVCAAEPKKEAAPA